MLVWFEQFSRPTGANSIFCDTYLHACDFSTSGMERVGAPLEAGSRRMYVLPWSALVLAVQGVWPMQERTVYDQGAAKLTAHVHIVW